MAKISDIVREKTEYKKSVDFSTDFWGYQNNMDYMAICCPAKVCHYKFTHKECSFLLNTFPVLRRKEKSAFGEFMSLRKLLEEHERTGKYFNVMVNKTERYNQ